MLPGYESGIREFQKTFGPYLSRVATDFEEAEAEYSWFESRVFGNPLDTVRRAKAKKQLKRISSALRAVGKYESGYFLPALVAARMDQEIRPKDAATDGAIEILNFLLTLGHLESDKVLSTSISRFEKYALRAIEIAQDTRNINWQAVHAIDTLRILWWRNTGKDAPSRALNPASKFAAFLDDGFHWLDIDADHISAFKRWSAMRPIFK
jgi:hypothetical protein